MALANTVALQKAGIARITPDPAGGVIVRDLATGEPTGILKNAAMSLVARNVPVPSAAEDDEALEAAMKVTFGSDWTVAPINPLLGIYAAVTRRTLDGKNPQGWVPQEKISVEEALRCY